MENYDNMTETGFSRDNETKGRKAHDRSVGARPKRYSDSSADEAKAAIKETVARGVATVAGAVEGFADTMRDSRLAETTKDAIELAGQTLENVTRTTKEQALKIRDAAIGTASDLKGNLSYGSDLKSARDSGALGSSALGKDSYGGV